MASNPGRARGLSLAVWFATATAMSATPASGPHSIKVKHVTGGAEGAFDERPSTEWRVRVNEPGASRTVVTLERPSELSELVVVNTGAEGQFPGISAKELQLDTGLSADGPWLPAGTFDLQKGVEPQRFELGFLEHLAPLTPDGIAPWVRQPLHAVRWLRVAFKGSGNPTFAAVGKLELWGVASPEGQ